MPVQTETSVSTNGTVSTVTVTVRDTSGTGGTDTYWTVLVNMKPGSYQAPTHVGGTMTGPVVGTNYVLWSNQQLMPGTAITGVFRVQFQSGVATGVCHSIEANFTDLLGTAGNYTPRHKMCVYAFQPAQPMMARSSGSKTSGGRTPARPEKGGSKPKKNPFRQKRKPGKGRRPK
jgi:hypothetical protein